jgi:hypothetical protein
MIAKSSADRQVFIIAFRWDRRKFVPLRVKEERMTKFLISAAVALVIASPAAANHVFYVDTPFASRGDCEAQRAELSNGDDWLIDAFPQLFSSEGEVRSFLNRAFTCEARGTDSQWYITDHRVEVLGSDWFQRRNR